MKDFSFNHIALNLKFSLCIPSRHLGYIKKLHLRKHNLLVFFRFSCWSTLLVSLLTPVGKNIDAKDFTEINALSWFFFQAGSGNKCVQ